MPGYIPPAIMSTAVLKHRPPFADAMASVETMPLGDQVALVEVVSKRIASARRAEMLREAAGARRDLRQGKVKRGSAADLMAELRSK